MKMLDVLLLTPLRLGLGGLFCFSAFMKLRNVQEFGNSVKAFQIFDLDKVEHLAMLTAYTIPWLELFSGVLLVLGLWSRPAAVAAAGQLVVFTIGIASVLQRDLEVRCGCFGKYEWPCTGPISICHIWRNAALLLIALILVARGGGFIGLDGFRKGRPSAAKNAKAASSGH